MRDTSWISTLPDDNSPYDLFLYGGSPPLPSHQSWIPGVILARNVTFVKHLAFRKEKKNFQKNKRKNESTCKGSTRNSQFLTVLVGVYKKTPCLLEAPQ